MSPFQKSSPGCGKGLAVTDPGVIIQCIHSPFPTYNKSAAGNFASMATVNMHFKLTGQLSNNFVLMFLYLTLYQIPISHLDLLKNMATRGPVLPYMAIVIQFCILAVKGYWSIWAFPFCFFCHNVFRSCLLQMR